MDLPNYKYAHGWSCLYNGRPFLLKKRYIRVVEKTKDIAKDRANFEVWLISPKSCAEKRHLKVLTRV